MQLWDLTHNTEVPLASALPQGVTSLNKVRGGSWHLTPGELVLLRAPPGGR